MVDLELIQKLSRPSPSKIILLIIDGLGGLPDPATGKSELETAAIPNLDRLASRGITGMVDPIGPGITPGSAPGHLALFGYDPLKFDMGRGVLETIGIDIELKPGDIAARGNFCTVDKDGLVTDRRAGRIPTDKCRELCKILSDISLTGVQVAVYPVREHRFVVVFSGDNLSPGVTESDPQQTGTVPLMIDPIERADAVAVHMADTVNHFISQARDRLADHHPANMVLLRGFSRHPQIPTMREVYKINPLAVAVYPMYRGLARLVGMDIAETGTTLEDEFETVRKEYHNYDFFFVHVKWTDSAGEDGDFSRKVKMLEEIDAALPLLTELNPDVMVITGDHSTPAALHGHSWHSVPVVIVSDYCRPDPVIGFSENAFLAGGLGRMSSMEIIHVAMANALKLRKYGA